MIYFPLGAWRKKLKSIIDNIKKMHPAIKFTTAWSKTSINYLNVTEAIAERVRETGLYVKPTDSYQFLLSSSCHSFYCTKVTPYSQALTPSRICSNNKNFEKRCNDLEMYLLERGYSEKMIRKETLPARAIPRDALLKKGNDQKKQNKITFNMTYHPVF